MHCDDAGDAPDSTNHFGAAMAAYPALGVQANYPTVFDPATGADQGPIHRNPHPFHLGAQFSIEGDADRLPDQDGVRNIVPPADNPNNDRADDGASINQIAFDDCRTTNIPVKVFIGPGAAAFFAAHVGNGARRPDRRVELERPSVRRAHGARCGSERRIGIASLADDALGLRQRLEPRV